MVSQSRLLGYAWRREDLRDICVLLHEHLLRALQRELDPDGRGESELSVDLGVGRVLWPALVQDFPCDDVADDPVVDLVGFVAPPSGQHKPLRVWKRSGYHARANVLPCQLALVGVALGLSALARVLPLRVFGPTHCA